MSCELFKSAFVAIGPWPGMIFVFASPTLASVARADAMPPIHPPVE